MQPTPPAEVTTREAAVILGYAHSSSLTRMVADGKLYPTRKLPGRTGAYLFDLAEIEALRDLAAAS